MNNGVVSTEVILILVDSSSIKLCWYSAQIASASVPEGAVRGSRLPTAHTCFNMICLPEHNSFQEFEQSLLTALNEGSEGFLLA